ncbi:MAG: hypothetical protein ACRYFL_04580 [Janthinobacterium lividum]
METNVHTNEGLTHSSNFSRSSGFSQRISWAAVFAGLIIAVFVQLALTLLGLAIGLSTVDATNHNTPGNGLAIGSGVWYVVSLLISLFIGGWVAGRLAKDKHTSESVIHGLLVCGLMFILTFYLLTSALGNLIGGAGSLAGKAISTAAPSINEAAQNHFGNGNQLATDSAKVAGTVNQNKDEAEQKARQVADDAASATSKGALYTFFGILLGAIASAFGAKKGRDSKVPADYYATKTAEA